MDTNLFLNTLKVYKKILYTTALNNTFLGTFSKKYVK